MTIKGIMNFALVAVAASAFGSLLLAAQAVAPQGTPAGEQLYRRNCTICHGDKGDGRGIAEPSIGGKIANFTNPDFWKETDDRKMVNVILKGQGRMPAQSVSPEEAKAIVEYMKSAFKGKYGS